MPTQPHGATLTATRVEAADHDKCVIADSDGTPVATVRVADHGPSVQLTFTISLGHLSMITRRELVDAVFRLPELSAARAVQAAAPLGDAELLHLLLERLDQISTRAAGVTCLIEGITRKVHL
jgi:hypothetical protein